MIAGPFGEGLDRLAHRWMEDSGCELGQGLQHERPFGQTGMRQREIGVARDGVAIEDQIEVELSGTPPQRGAPAAGGGFDRVKLGQQHWSWQYGRQFGARIQVGPLEVGTLGEGLVNSRTPDEAGPVQLRQSGKGEAKAVGAVSSIAAERYEGSCQGTVAEASGRPLSSDSSDLVT